MNKKHANPSTSSEPKSVKSKRRSVKQELQRCNRELIQLCNERAKLFAGLDGLDDVNDLLSHDEIEQRLQKQKGPLATEDLRAVFRELDSATRAIVRPTSIAFLGPEFSYSHLAAIEQFGQANDLLPVSSISGVFEAVKRGDTDYGVVPIENSTDGRIVDTLEMFVRLPVRICGEVPVQIHHNLLGSGKITDIVEVHSKPQALSQCRAWLARSLPKVRLVEATSTTAAAELAAERKDVAAVASRQAGVNYGLNVLAENIEDNANNVTRFAVIGTSETKRTGRDKTSIMFELAHQPGALADVMVIFRRNRLNLTWIESFPKPSSPNEYYFFIELEGHTKDAAVRRALSSLENKTVEINILGSYPRV